MREELPYKEHIMELFNNGVLTEKADEWYAKQGYKVIREADKVVDIVKGAE